jgi:hypothetical protein
MFKKERYIVTTATEPPIFGHYTEHNLDPIYQMEGPSFLWAVRSIFKRPVKAYDDEI